MAEPKLPADVLIEDVASRLNKPVDYVRHVFGNMNTYKRDHGTAHLRLGTTGRGLAPNYRIEPAPDRHAFLSEVKFDEGDWGDTSKYFIAFNGSSHKQMEWGAAELQGAHWSEKYTSYDDVQALLGRLRRLVLP